MKRQGRATVRPKRTALQAIVPPHLNEQSKAERCEQAGVELRSLHKTNALLIAVQYAANEECDFDVSDALATIIERFEQHIATVDLLTLEDAP